MTKTQSLICPYNECKRNFDQPVMLTDLSNTPRKTYYACPHCLTKVDLIAKDPTLNKVSLEASADETPEKAPNECTFQLGFVSTQTDSVIPDSCLTCSKLLQCMVKRDTR